MSSSRTVGMRTLFIRNGTLILCIIVAAAAAVDVVAHHCGTHNCVILKSLKKSDWKLCERNMRLFHTSISLTLGFCAHTHARSQLHNKGYHCYSLIMFDIWVVSGDDDINDFCIRPWDIRRTCPPMKRKNQKQFVLSLLPPHIAISLVGLNTKKYSMLITSLFLSYKRQRRTHTPSMVT